MKLRLVISVVLGTFAAFGCGNAVQPGNVPGGGPVGSETLGGGGRVAAGGGGESSESATPPRDELGGSESTSGSGETTAGCGVNVVYCVDQCGNPENPVCGSGGWTCPYSAPPVGEIRLGPGCGTPADADTLAVAEGCFRPCNDKSDCFGGVCRPFWVNLCPDAGELSCGDCSQTLWLCDLEIR